MVRVILLFVLVFVGFYAGIHSLQKLSKLEAISLTKLIAYSTLCTVLTTGVLYLIVILF